MRAVDPFPQELIPMRAVPVPYLCPLHQHSPPFHASFFSSATRLTSVLLLSASKVFWRLRQEKVSQSVYNHVEGQQCEGVWKADHRHCKLQHRTWGAVHMGQEVEEGALCVRGSGETSRDLL